MAEEEKTRRKRSVWDVFVGVMTFATPILVVVLGIILNRDISNIETRIANVEAMSTYFKMMAGTDVAQAKMAAYALYMLNRDDPAMAVSVLLAGASGEGGSKAPKHFLMDVLKDLASRDEKFRQSLQKIVATSDSTGVDTEAQVRAYEVIESVSVKPPPSEVAAGEEQKKQKNQWCYLGRFRSNRWSDSSLKIKTNQPVKEGPEYELVKDVRLRAGYPQKPDYKLAKTVGVAHKGSRVEIKEVQYVGTGVWAKVSIVE